RCARADPRRGVHAPGHRGHSIMATRRQFVQGVGVAGLGLVAGCGRLPFHSQQPAKVHRIGYLSGPAPGRPQLEDAFHQGLRELGYIEGQTIIIEYRRAEEGFGRLPDLAAELVSLPVDLIFAPNTPGIVAAQQATGTIPIVMAGAADPIGSGFIASLAHPGGNVTGTTQSASQLAAKRLELLREVAPTTARMAVI